MLSHLADVSIRSVLLALIAAVVVWALRGRRSAAAQHAVWTAVVCGMLALLVLSPALPRLPLRVLASPPPRIAAPVVAVATPKFEDVLATAAAPSTPPRRSIDWNEVVAYAYAAIAFAFFARFVTGMFLARRLLVKSVPVQGFYESARISVPLTVGWLRPKILLPLDWRDWDREKLDAVLAHEGSHLRRRDGLIAALAGVNRCIFWFHPLAWWLEGRLALLAELACDESCVAMLGNREAYATLLLDMARVVDQSQGRLQSHALTMAAPSHIRQRIESVLRDRKPSRGLSRAGWAAVALCGIPLVWGAGAVTVDRQTPLLQLSVPRLDVPAPPALLAQAQTRPAPPAAKPAARLEFEVASIRPAAPTPSTGNGGGARGGGGGARGGGKGPDCRPGFNVDASRLDLRCDGLVDLIWRGTDVFVSRIKGPDWLMGPSSPRFDIAAKLPQGASEDQVPEMLLTLLEDRFKLAFHRETKEEPGLGLVMTKSGLKLTEATPGPVAPFPVPTAGRDGSPLLTGMANLNGIPYHMTRFRNPDGPGFVNIMDTAAMGSVRDRDSTASPGVRHVEAPNISAQGLADLMTMLAGQGAVPVVDMTGLKGRYNVTLDIDMEETLSAADPGASSDALVDAVRDALKKYGLQLEQRKTPVEYLVVDRLEKAPTEN